MRILMFGWEFPPYSKGGLGTACYGLTKGLSKNGVDITMVTPQGEAGRHEFVDLLVAGDLYINPNVAVKKINSILHPYLSVEQYINVLNSSSSKEIYGQNLFEEVQRYAEKAGVIASFENFDMIHAHDWLTFPAAIKAKKLKKKPFVAHVHATEYDRSGGRPHDYVYKMEREGMEAADRIITVSNFTKDTIVNNYGISEDKITVVHNAVLHSDETDSVFLGNKIVLFLGRITVQKGPLYFLKAAQKVIKYDPKVTFVVAGDGDMYEEMKEYAKKLRISGKVVFTGHLHGDAVDRAYKLASLYVMPSISEPFGITPLEALRNNTPVLISKQSGVSEILHNALKADFWDTTDMANKIISALTYTDMHKILAQNGNMEIKGLKWEDAALKCIDVYHSCL